MSFDRLSRRGFVVAGAAAAGSALLPGEAHAAKKKAKKDPASDLVNIAIIGAGGMGKVYKGVQPSIECQSAAAANQERGSLG